MNELTNTAPGSVWRKHVRSSMTRTIVENCYRHMIRERDENNRGKLNKRVVVVCPAEEHHDLGARMVADFFILAGYDTTYVGSNTPKEEFKQIFQ